MRRLRRIVTPFAAVLVATVTALATASAGASPHGAAGLTFDRGSSKLTVWEASTAGTGAHRLGPGGDTVTSPSGQLIAANSAGPARYALVVYGAAGGQHTFFDPNRFSATPLAWSPDSRYLLVAVTNGNDRGDGLELIDTRTWSASMVARGVVAAASFDPRDPALYVYDLTGGQSLTSPVNLWQRSTLGGRASELTHDGRSLNPLWTARGIVYDDERFRGDSSFPEYQLWLRNGVHAHQLTRVHVPSLLAGLVPIAADADGNRLIANFEGEDTSYAVTVQLSPLRLHTVNVGGPYPVGAGISRDGRTVLLDAGSFEEPASDGTVDTQPFFGGRARVLTRGGNASWNG